MPLLAKTAPVLPALLRRPMGSNRTKQAQAAADREQEQQRAHAAQLRMEQEALHGLPPADPTPTTAGQAADRLAPDEAEVDWIWRARQGDSAAFDWLLHRYRDRAVRLAAHVLRRPDEAEDVTQEAFLRAFGQIRAFRGDCAFYSWLYPIVVRCCLNRMRQPGWKREQDTSFADGQHWTDGEASPARQLETRDLIAHLLAELTPPLRAALILREVEGLTYDEIATVLAIPVGTVRSRLNAAREQFRAHYQRIQEECNRV